MKLLIDINVVLDVLLRREPFFSKAAKALNLTQREEVSASAITDVYYLLLAVSCPGVSRTL